MFVLAHLSDPHLGPIPRPRLADLANKRLLGFVNWHLRRQRQHRRDVLDAVVGDMKAAAPNHVAVTGDLVNIALDAEFAPARHWLESVGSPAEVTLVPGNHDVYVRATATHAERFLSQYMCGDLDGATAAPRFPFVRRRGPVALVGVSSALPTAPLLATGRVGPDQLARLGPMLGELKTQQAFRVVLIHHPPVSTHSRHKRLVDAPALRGILREHGAELVLHGHDHLHSLAWTDGPGGRIPVIGVPSASAALHGDEDPAAYNLFMIDGGPGAWRCELIVRGLSAKRDGIVEVMRRTIVGAP
jgi:3',5'-cyclic AMP phosphodiesterase CpdA